MPVITHSYLFTTWNQGCQSIKPLKSNGVDDTTLVWWRRKLRPHSFKIRPVSFHTFPLLDAFAICYRGIRRRSQGWEPPETALKSPSTISNPSHTTFTSCRIVRKLFCLWHHEPRLVPSTIFVGIFIGVGLLSNSTSTVPWLLRP